MTNRKRVPPRGENPTDRAGTENNRKASGYGRTLYLLIERKLQERPEKPAYIPPDQLSRAIRLNPGVPIPPIIQDYLCDYLDGTIKAPAGRPPGHLNLQEHLKTVLIPITYHRYYAWLRKRKKSIGLKGWSFIAGTDWWQGPPSERAARMTCTKLRLYMGWRRVLNIVSETKE